MLELVLFRLCHMFCHCFVYVQVLSYCFIVCNCILLCVVVLISSILSFVCVAHSSSNYSPISRQQPAADGWTSYRTNSAGFSTSPPNSADSVAKSLGNPGGLGNPAGLRSTLPADYKPSGGYGSTPRQQDVRSTSSSSNSLGGAGENRPRF